MQSDCETPVFDKFMFFGLDGFGGYYMRNYTSMLEFYRF